MDMEYFFDMHGVVHHEFVPEAQTGNAAFYVEVLKRLRDRVSRVRQNYSICVASC